jgi:hypothetical protein
MTDTLYRAIAAYHLEPSAEGRARVGELVQAGHLDPVEATILTKALKHGSAWGLRLPWGKR